ncbi:hypothetical protein D3C72_2110920 [compost metagenome]
MHRVHGGHLETDQRRALLAGLLAEFADDGMAVLVDGLDLRHRDQRVVGVFPVTRVVCDGFLHGMSSQELALFFWVSLSERASCPSRAASDTWRSRLSMRRPETARLRR